MDSEVRGSVCTLPQLCTGAEGLKCHLVKEQPSTHFKAFWLTLRYFKHLHTAAAPCTALSWTSLHSFHASEEIDEILGVERTLQWQLLMITQNGFRKVKAFTWTSCSSKALSVSFTLRTDVQHYECVCLLCVWGLQFHSPTVQMGSQELRYVFRSKLWECRIQNKKVHLLGFSITFAQKTSTY